MDRCVSIVEDDRQCSNGPRFVVFAPTSNPEDRWEVCWHHLAHTVTDIATSHPDSLSVRVEVL